MRAGGVLPDPVSQPANQVWQAPAPAPLPAHRVRLGHRAALLCPPRRQDAHRDPDQGHAPVRQHIPVADLVHGLLHVKIEKRKTFSASY